MTATVTNSFRNWKPINIGAGGFISGYDQHTDGTLVARADTYGAFLWDAPTSTWKPLITESSIPSGTILHQGGGGCFEIRIAKTNSSILYMVYNGRVYKSTNKGTSWTQTNFAPLNADYDLGANSGLQRIFDRKMAIDPLNANVVYVGTMNSGLFRTLDGGTTWTQLAVPVSPGSATDQEAGITGIIFDPTASNLSGRSSKLYAHSRGNGYYVSTNGGDTWTLVANGPTAAISSCTFDAQNRLWALIYPSQGVWRLTGSTWQLLRGNGTTLPNVPAVENGGYSIFVDPFNTNRIVIGRDSGHLSHSLDGGASFTDYFWGSLSVTSTDIPWLGLSFAGQVPSSIYLAVGKMAFDTVTPNKINLAMGIGFLSASVTSTSITTDVAWQSMSRGIEQLVGHNVLSMPSGKTYWTGQDRALFDITNPRVFPSTYQLNRGATIRHGQTISFLPSNPNIMAVPTKFLVGGQVGGSEYSLDGGSTWNIFSTYPPFTFSDGTPATPGDGGGEIVPLSADHYLWFPTQGFKPHRTSNRGQTWQRIVLPGVSENLDPNGGTDYNSMNFAYFLRKQNCAADPSTTGKAWVYHPILGLFQTTDYGASWTNIYPSQIAPFGGFNARLKSVVGKPGHLWWTAGPQATPSMATHEPTRRWNRRRREWAIHAIDQWWYDLDSCWNCHGRDARRSGSHRLQFREASSWSKLPDIVDRRLCQ
jgi:hypothetical protein